MKIKQNFEGKISTEKARSNTLLDYPKEIRGQRGRYHGVDGVKADVDRDLRENPPT